MGIPKEIVSGIPTEVIDQKCLSKMSTEDLYESLWVCRQHGWGKREIGNLSTVISMLRMCA
jgi:hypothetical protein